jgi:uncharacterized protein (TIGR02266 family)
MIRSRVVSAHFRLRPRYPLKVRVVVRRQNERSSREIDGSTENLGFGGAFVLLDPPFPPGTLVVLSISSATTWDPLKLNAVVRWVRDARPGIPAGMGVAFDALLPEHAIALHRLFGAYGFEHE